MRGDSRTDSACRELHEHVVMQFRDEDDGMVAVAEWTRASRCERGHGPADVSVDTGQ